MADIKTQDIVDFFNNLSPDSAKKFFDQLVNSSAVAKNALETLKKTTTSVSDGFKTVKESAEETWKKVQTLNDFDFQNFLRGLSAGNTELAVLTSQVALLGGALLTNIKPDAFNAMGNAASDMNLDLNKSVENISKIASIIPSFGLAPKIVEGYKIFAELAEPAKKLESGLIASYAASGQLSELLKEVGDDLTGLEDKSISYAEIVYNVANATGLGTEQTGKYAFELNKIPGALSTIIDLTGDGANQMNLLEAAMKVATGTGQNFSAVSDEMNEVYRNFGTVGKDALAVVARLATTSQNLKLPLDLVKDYLSGTGNSFRYFADNSQSALSILNRFGPALQEGGLGPKAIADLTQGITRNVAELSTAQRAFLSATTGGPGGLQGSYQIELLKKQGKTEDIEKLVEQSLRKQFGGRILTLEEAAKDQASAAQFAKQVQLVTQGPTKLANTEGEAYRILDAMAKGLKSPQAEEARAGQKPQYEAINSTIDIGNKIQERNYNQLVAITNQLEFGSQYASITANALTRGILGPGIGEKVIEKRREEASEKAATKSLLIGTGMNTLPVPEMGLKEAISSKLSNIPTLQSIKDTVSSVTDGLMTKIENEKDRLKGSVVSDVVSSNTQTVIQQSKQATFSPVQQLPPQNSEITVELIGVCPQCNKQIIESTILKTVDGKLEEADKKRAMHMHTGVNL